MITKDNIREKLIKAGFVKETWRIAGINNKKERYIYYLVYHFGALNYIKVYIKFPIFIVQKGSWDLIKYNLDEFLSFLTKRGIVLEDECEHEWGNMQKKCFSGF